MLSLTISVLSSLPLSLPLTLPLSVIASYTHSLSSSAALQPPLHSPFFTRRNPSSPCRLNHVLPAFDSTHGCRVVFAFTVVEKFCTADACLCSSNYLQTLLLSDCSVFTKCKCLCYSDVLCSHSPTAFSWFPCMHVMYYNGGCTPHCHGEIRP